MFNRRRLLFLLASVLFLLAWAAPAGAVERLSGQTVTVPPGEILGPLFIAGQDVVINGNVDGDVFAAGRTIVVNGKIDGDLLAAGQTILINGTVTGSARCLANQITVQAKLGQSLTAVARNLEQLPGSTVTRDVVALTQNTVLSGTVGRQVLGAGSSISLNGPVGGGIQLWSVNRLDLGPGADITGNVDYRSPANALVDPGAKITGKINWQPLPVSQTAAPRHHRFNWWWLLISFAAGALVWGLLALLFPGLWGGLSQTVRRSPWPALGWGLVGLVAVPPLILLLLITVIGIPLSLTLLAAYIALIYVADLTGRLLAARFGWVRPFSRVVSFLAGLVALILLGKIPVAGFLISLAVACLGIGAVILAVYHWRQRPSQPVSPD